MRAILIAFAYLAFMVAMTLANSMDSQYYSTEGRHMFTTACSANLDLKNYNNLTQAQNEYGLNQLPALQNQGAFYYLSNTMSSLGVLGDFMWSASLGAGDALRQSCILPSMLSDMAFFIGVFVTLLDIIAIVTIVRGVYVGR